MKMNNFLSSAGHIFLKKIRVVREFILFYYRSFKISAIISLVSTAPQMRVRSYVRALGIHSKQHVS